MKVEEWDKEHFFFNPLILNQSDETWNLTKHCDDKKIFYLGEIIDEKVKQARNIPFDRAIRNMYDKIKLSRNIRGHKNKSHLYFYAVTVVRILNFIIV